MGERDIPDDALEPEEAVARLDKDRSDVLDFSDMQGAYVPMEGFAGQVDIGEITFPEGTRTTVVFLVRHIDTDEQEYNATVELSPESAPEPPTNFVETEESFVRECNQEECDLCSGSGRIDCRNCRGSGFVTCPRSKCRNGVLKERCSCDEGKLARECGNCSNGTVSKTYIEDGETRQKNEECDICDGDGELYRECDRCAGSGMITVGECSRCTQEDPIGKVPCDECETPDHTVECNKCDGYGELVVVTREYHEYKVIEDSVITIDNDFKDAGMIEWASTPTNTYETEDVPEINGIESPTDGEVIRVQVEEYEPNDPADGQAYSFKYYPQIDHDTRSTPYAIVNGSDVTGVPPFRHDPYYNMGPLRTTIQKVMDSLKN